MATTPPNWPKGPAWRHARARRGLKTRAAAEALGITRQSLTNIESEQPKASVSLVLAYKAAALYRVPVKDLLKAQDGVPDEPPGQPKPKPKPPPKRERAGTRPKVDNGAAA